MSSKLLERTYAAGCMRGLTPNEKVVLAYLWHRFNDNTQRCNPGQDTIANAVGMSRRNVSRSICGLVAKGIVERLPERHKHGDGYCYRPVFNGCQGDTPCESDKGCQFEAQGVSIQTQGVSIQTATGVKVTPNRIDRSKDRESDRGQAPAPSLSADDIASVIRGACYTLGEGIDPKLSEDYIRRNGHGAYSNLALEVLRDKRAKDKAGVFNQRLTEKTRGET